VCRLAHRSLGHLEGQEHLLNGAHRKNSHPA
jgi:hypothetical protein